MKSTIEILDTRFRLAMKDGRIAAQNQRQRSGAYMIITVCSCGKQYTAEQFKQLEYCGQMLKSDGYRHDLELRNCSCNSTISALMEKL